jgi:hypothetical protein
MPSSRSAARLIFTLPRPLAEDLARYARAYRGGNKSGFVADALTAYIRHLQHFRHTRQLRQAYAASRRQAAGVNRDWQGLDDEAWGQLEQRPASPR